MKNFQKILTTAALLAGTAFMTSCNGEVDSGDTNGDDPIEEKLSSVTIVAGETTISSIAFSVVPKDAIFCYYLVRESTEEIPTVDELKAGVSIGVTIRDAVVDNLKHSTSYEISAVAVNADDVICDIVTVEMETKSIPVYTEGEFSGEAIFVGGKWWAPVNCGYDDVDYLYGKLYQWGRIDGQGYTSGNAKDKGEVVNPTIVLDGPLDFSDGKMPLIPANTRYKCKSSSNLDWRTPQENLWLPETKTAADPCPAGWRVPTVAEFENLNLANTKEIQMVDANDTKIKVAFFGENFETATLEDTKGCVLFHKSGNSYMTGTTGSRGSTGLFWASDSITPTEDDDPYFSKHLCISMITDVRIDSGWRVLGMSVRCIQE